MCGFEVEEVGFVGVPQGDGGWVHDSYMRMLDAQRDNERMDERLERRDMLVITITSYENYVRE